MPKSIIDTTGDGVIVPYVQFALTLAAAGAPIQGEGNVTPIGGSLVPLTGFPLTAPATPASGFVYWILQVNTTSGLCSIKQSTIAPPVADAGNVAFFSQTISLADADLGQDIAFSTVDEW